MTREEAIDLVQRTARKYYGNPITTSLAPLSEEEGKERITRWVAALRSGQYPQTEGVLKRRDDNGQVVGYCCMGVYCIAVNGQDSSSSSYPDRTDHFPLERVASVFADFNDHQRMTFPQIADIVELVWLKEEEAVV